MNKYQWYRKKMGGNWYHIIVRPYPYMDMWVRTKPFLWEKLISIENWASKNRFIGRRYHSLMEDKFTNY